MGGTSTSRIIRCPKIRIESEIQTRAMDFQSEFVTKCIGDGKLWMTDIATTTDMTTSLRTDEYGEWSPWSEDRLAVAGDSCGNRECCEDKCHDRRPSQPETRSRYSLGSPQDTKDCKHAGEGLGSSGEEVQAQHRWKGHLCLDRAMYSAMTVDDDNPPCADEDLCKAEPHRFCPESDYDYNIYEEEVTCPYPSCS